ncbi:MAG: hypothetical protein FRX49_02548 [Trebouxia sp. A1-2]|nr:MAG: hypothetical protein FRX49_02548 [Trebouxia sp. A1-2]
MMIAEMVTIVAQPEARIKLHEVRFIVLLDQPAQQNDLLLLESNNPRTEHLIILHELAKLRESPSWGSLPVGSLLCFEAGGSPEAGSQSLELAHTDPAPLEEG